MRINITSTNKESTLELFDELQRLKAMGVADNTSTIMSDLRELFPAGYYDNKEDFSLALNGYLSQNGDQLTDSVSHMNEEDAKNCLLSWEAEYRLAHDIGLDDNCLREKSGLLSQEQVEELFNLRHKDM